MQQLYHRATGEFPTVDNLLNWLRMGSAFIYDGDDEEDNVEHTNAEFRRICAPGALQAVYRYLQAERLRAGGS
jgi:hypothetical protein